jgi:hypothetical protein
MQGLAYPPKWPDDETVGKVRNFANAATASASLMAPTFGVCSALPRLACTAAPTATNNHTKNTHNRHGEINDICTHTSEQSKHESIANTRCHTSTLGDAAGMPCQSEHFIVCPSKGSTNRQMPNDSIEAVKRFEHL